MADLNDAGFWARFWGRLTGRLRLGKGEQTAPDGYTAPDGTPVNSNTALTLSAVWACVRLRAQTIASLPLHLRDEGNLLAKSHPLYRILHDSPNADMCAAEFWEAMIAALDLNGNAYAEIVRSKGGVVALNVLDPERMTVKREKSGEIGYLYDAGGEKLYYRDENILHLRGFTLDGLVGISPIRQAAEMMGGQIAANRAAMNEFKNRLKAGGVLQYDGGILNEEQRKKLRAMLNEYTNPEKAGAFLVLEKHFSLAGTNLKLNPADAQLLESRMFGVEEICRIFGVPPQLIGHTDKASSWASSLDGTNMGFLTYTLRPVLVKIEQTISKKLLSPAERLQYRPKFAVEGLLRADTGARAGFYTQMLQNGVMSRNDVRRLEDLPPVEGGDTLTVQLNMTTINQIGKLEKP